jgi:hypothetical protein
VSHVVARARRPQRAAGLVSLLIAAALASVGACSVGPRPTSPPVSPPATPSPVPEPSSSEPAATPGHIAVVAIIGGQDEGIAGTLGSYTLDGRGGDSPWLPFDELVAVHQPLGEPLEIRLVDGGQIAAWSAQFAAAEDVGGLSSRDMTGPAPDQPAPFIQVGPLPPGRWVLAVQLVRADDRGEGTTYWAITVE